MKFEILTPLGFTVRTSKSYWQRLITKHPDIADLENLVQQTLHPSDNRFDTVSVELGQLSLT